MADLLDGIAQPAPKPVTLAEQIAEVEREVNLRKRVYPAWDEREPQMKPTRARYLRRLEAALQTLKDLAAAGVVS